MARKKDGHLFSLISIIVSFALILIFALVGFTFMFKTIQTMEAQRRDQTQIHEANLATITTKDPSTGKILLDDAFIKEEYRYFHEGEVNGARTFQLLLRGITVAIIGICLFSATIPIIKASFRGERYSFLRAAIALIPIIFVVGFYIVVGGKMMDNAKPAPETARYTIYIINILRRQAITTTDSDGDTHTTYKIIFASNQGDGDKELTVTKAMYDSVPDYTLPSDYYLVEAVDGIDSKYFSLFYSEKYQLP